MDPAAAGPLVCQYSISGIAALAPLSSLSASATSASVVISSEPVISQPGPLSQGRTVQAQREQIEIRQDKGLLTMVKGANLSEVVKALNAVGATPQDLLAIRQAMKASGALRA